MRKSVLNTDPLVHHGLSTDLLNATAFACVARDFMDKIIISPSACTAIHGNLFQKPVWTYHLGAAGLIVLPVCCTPREGPGGSELPSLSFHTCLAIPQCARPALSWASACWWNSISDLKEGIKIKPNCSLMLSFSEELDFPFTLSEMTQTSICQQESKTGADKEFQTKFFSLRPSVTLFLPVGAGHMLLWQIACILA